MVTKCYPWNYFWSIFHLYLYDNTGIDMFALDALPHTTHTTRITIGGVLDIFHLDMRESVPDRDTFHSMLLGAPCICLQSWWNKILELCLRIHTLYKKKHLGVNNVYVYTILKNDIKATKHIAYVVPLVRHEWSGCFRNRIIWRNTK